MSDLGNNKVMAENIKRLMELTGKTRSDLCKDLNIAYTTISDWINGKTYPRIDKIELLANYFGVEKADLVEKQHFKHNSNTKTLELIDLHMKGILHWSTEIGISESQTTALYEHIDELLLKYKLLIEQFSYSNLRWNEDQKMYTTFLRQRNKDITDAEIRKSYMQQELSDILQQLVDCINAFPVYMANREVKKDNIIDLHQDYLEPNAAHANDNATPEENTNDDNIMDNDNEWK